MPIILADLKYDLALFHTLGMGNQSYQYLLEMLQNNQLSLADIFEKPKRFDQLLKSLAIDSLEIKPKFKKKQLDLLQQAIKNPPWKLVDKDLIWAEQQQHHLLSCRDPDYPQLLKQQANYPLLLYVMGNKNTLSDIQLAIVGSRTPTPSALENAYQFAYYLAKNGMVITSGLALGIDAASHKGAIDAKGKTIAIAGTGIDRVYPAKHKDLAHKIVEHGAIVSEFPLGTSPLRQNFPKRNQIISALSVGTLVVEAALKSGSLITARLAMEQGREVFAIPGSIHNPLAKGCHYLIKQGAKLVEKAEDIIEEIKPLSMASSMLKQQGVQQQRQQKAPLKSITMPTMPKDQQQILKFLDDQAITIDKLQQRSQMPIDDINSLIVLLEIQGYIISLPGGKISLNC